MRRRGRGPRSPPRVPVHAGRGVAEVRGVVEEDRAELGAGVLGLRPECGGGRDDEHRAFRSRDVPGGGGVAFRGGGVAEAGRSLRGCRYGRGHGHRGGRRGRGRCRGVAEAVAVGLVDRRGVVRDAEGAVGAASGRAVSNAAGDRGAGGVGIGPRGGWSSSRPGCLRRARRALVRAMTPIVKRVRTSRIRSWPMNRPQNRPQPERAAGSVSGQAPARSWGSVIRARTASGVRVNVTVPGQAPLEKSAERPVADQTRTARPSRNARRPTRAPSGTPPARAGGSVRLGSDMVTPPWSRSRGRCGGVR